MGRASAFAYALSLLWLAPAAVRSGELEDAAAAAAPGTCAMACGAGDCTGQMRLPDHYNATIDFGAPPPDDGGEMSAADIGSLDGLHAVGEMLYATHPRKAGQFQRASPALGAKFRNFRKTALEMRWDDGSKEGVYSGSVAAMGRTSTLT